MHPITVRLLPSRIMLMLFVTATVFFGWMLFLVSLPYWLRIATLGLIVANTLYFIYRDALLAFPWSYISLNINANNQLKLVRKDGGQLDVDVQKNTVVTAYLTVLNCQLKEATFFQRLLPQHIVILPDTINLDDHRRLRVWLRWAKLKPKN
jgi:toxin CptA